MLSRRAGDAQRSCLKRRSTRSAFFGQRLKYGRSRNENVLVALVSPGANILYRLFCER